MVDPARRYAAMYGLAMWKPPAGRGDELYGYGLAGLKDESPDVRRAATNVVGNADGPGALAALRPMLSDPDESVRVEAVTQVAWLGNPGSVDALIDVLKDQDGKPAEVAAGWLATIGGEEAENALAAALAKSHSQRLADAIKEGRKAREWLSREEPAKKD